MVVVASPSLSVHRRIHAGVLQGPAMEVAASPVSIRPPPDRRGSSRDPPPIPRRLGRQEGQRPRQAAGGLAARLACRKRARELTPVPAKATFGDFHVRRALVRLPRRQVRRALVRLARRQGLFCKNETLYQEHTENRTAGLFQRNRGAFSQKRRRRTGRSTPCFISRERCLCLIFQ
ncbi:hypothetical protein VPH35_108363 [Triticum aestivum]